MLGTRGLCLGIPVNVLPLFKVGPHLSFWSSVWRKVDCVSVYLTIIMAKRLDWLSWLFVLLFLITNPSDVLKQCFPFSIFTQKKGAWEFVAVYAFYKASLWLIRKGNWKNYIILWLASLMFYKTVYISLCCISKGKITKKWLQHYNLIDCGFI